MGECSKNKRFMLSSCSRACEVCDEKRNGCSRRNATAGCATQVPNPRLAGPRQVCYSHVCASPWTVLTHLFLRVLPVPLPLRHAERSARCFWAKAATDVTHDTQAEILR